MPHTFMHPGFMYPLRKWKGTLFSTTGWVFGSLAPDYAFLLRLTNPRFHLFQYDWKTILLIIFPMALLSAVYFHVVIRNVLIQTAPGPIRQHYTAYADFDFVRYLRTHFPKVSMSILLAILLHLLLDLTVHLDANTFKMIAWNYYGTFWSGIFYYYLTMYGPAVIMSAVGLYFIIQMLREEGWLIGWFRALLHHKPAMRFLLLFGLFTIIFSAFKILWNGIEAGFAFDTFAIGITNGLLISFFLTPGLFYLRIQQHRQ